MRKLKGDALTIVDAAAQSFGMMAPIMASALLTSVVASHAGDAAPMALLVGGLASCSLGIIVAGYASKFSGAGAIYAFVSRAASPSLGFFCGWLYFAAVFLIACGGTAFLAVLTQQFCDMAFGMSPPFILVLVLENAALAACTVLDVRQSTRTQLVVTAVSAVLVLGCCAYAAIFNPLRPASPALFSPLRVVDGFGFGAGLAYALTMYAGFESAAVLGEETKNPLKAIPRAVLLTVALCTAYHTLVGTAQYTAFSSSAAWGDDEGALLTLVRTRVAPALAAPVFLAAAVDGFAGNIACVNAIARVGLHMARDGALPRWLGVVHQRYRTPFISSLLVCAASTALGAGFAAFAPPDTEFRLFLGIGSALLQIVYVILSMVALRDASWTHKLELVRFGPRDGAARNWFGERVEHPSLFAVTVRVVGRFAVPLIAVSCPAAALTAMLQPAANGEWPEVLVVPAAAAVVVVGALVLLYLRRTGSRALRVGEPGPSDGQRLHGAADEPAPTGHDAPSGKATGQGKGAGEEEEDEDDLGSALDMALAETEALLGPGGEKTARV